VHKYRREGCKILSLKSILIIAVCTLLILLLFFIIPLVRITRVVTYTTWYFDGRVESVTEEDVIWVTPHQYLFGGKLFFDTPEDLDSLKETLKKVRFKEEYRPGGVNELGCGEKSAVIMKYLKGKGYRVEMGRGKLSRDDEEEGLAHAWVLVHLESGTYVVEVNNPSGSVEVVGKVEDAAKDPNLKYIEKERWNMEKVKKITAST
jgi:hypothetical protein